MINSCDSSAVTKIYLEETGSAFMRKIRLSLPNAAIFVADIAGPEVLSAMQRRFRNGDLDAEMISEARKDFRRDYSEYFQRVPLSDPVVTLAMQLIEKYPLRGYDSVQLATAWHLQSTLRAFNGEEIRFLGADKVLNEAAQSERLIVIDPGEQE
ncbi:type II toxin-antitoxin system VapC family toxin [candidate division KSB1 bacterium]|nr:type II toxin-antitoxin system VapC family toxin [candidate division KSB1 bacterium]